MPTKIVLTEDEMPRQWCNMVAEAHKAKEEGKEKTILFSWSGHGLMDLSAYDNYLSGGLKDVPFTDGDLAQAIQGLEGYPRPGE